MGLWKHQKTKMSENVGYEDAEMKTVVSQQPNVVVVQPVRQLPGRWSTGYCNGPCWCAMFIPCMQFAFAASNGRKAGLPGICESQGCCFITLCCCMAFSTYALKARMLTQMRLGIPGDRNEMFWHGCCFPCRVGQTKQTLDENADLLAGPVNKNDMAYNVIETL